MMQVVVILSPTPNLCTDNEFSTLSVLKMMITELTTQGWNQPFI